MSTIVACLLFGILLTATSAHDKKEALDTMMASDQHVSGEDSLLDKLAETYEDGGSKYISELKRTIPEFETVLRPIILSLPRNDEGKLDEAATRYALHRTFVQMRGYHLEGLQSPGAAWNSSFSTSEIQLLRLMPAPKRQIVMKALEKGLELNDVVALAASLNMFIHLLGLQQLKGVYDMLELNSSTPLNEDETKKVVEFYVASQILGIDLERHKNARRRVLKFISRISAAYPTWNKTQNFIGDVLTSELAGQEKISFSHVGGATQKIDDSYGPWQNRECLALKQQLMKMEDHDSGRIRLANFYNKALSGNWQFMESVPYLRENGALDESNPNNIRVIIPNYINGLSNCIGASSYHKLCCISECESLLSVLERQLGKPEANPEELATLIAALPSSTVTAPRVLPELLMVRLRAIAIESANNLIPIHGRLFAQLLSHAYPRECDFPHLANTTQPVGIHRMVHDHKAALVTIKEMRHRATELPPPRQAPLASVPWIQQEELPYRQPEKPPFWFIVHCCAGVVAMLMIIGGFSRMAFFRVRRSGLAVKQKHDDFKGPFMA